MTTPLNQMTPDQLYKRLDWLTEHRRQNGRGRTPEAAYVRRYCKTQRAQVQRELKRRHLPTTRPGDTRVYGPGQATWQRASPLPAGGTGGGSQ